MFLPDALSIRFFYVAFQFSGVDGADGAAKTKQFFLTYFFSRTSFRKKDDNNR